MERTHKSCRQKSHGHIGFKAGDETNTASLRSLPHSEDSQKEFGKRAVADLRIVLLERGDNHRDLITAVESDRPHTRLLMNSRVVVSDNQAGKAVGTQVDYLCPAQGARSQKRRGKMKWYRDWIRKQFVKTFDRLHDLHREVHLKRFIAKEFPGLHVSRNPRRPK